MTELNRREFLKTSAFATTTLLLPISSCTSSSGVRFGLVTDSHYADRDPVGTRYYRQSMEKMAECIDIFNSSRLDFIVHLGDFKDEDPHQREVDTLKYLEQLEAEFGKYQGPRYHCVGNHDVDSIRKQQFLSSVENSGIKSGKSYYSFDSQGFHFIVLDANYHKNGEDQYYKEGADWQDPNIPDFELDWLKNDLKENDLPAVVFCHHPLFAYPSEGLNHSVNNYMKVQTIIESGNVLAAFQGHVHQEHYSLHHGIHYLTQLGMVDYEGLENNSFSIVEIANSRIELTGFKRVSNQQYYLHNASDKQ